VTLSIRSTPDQIANVLRSEIESGSLSAGRALNQEQLAARFNLSRIPIREALRQLEAEGYIVYLPNKGATVASAPSKSELIEILEIRACLEEHVMQRAAANATQNVANAARQAMEVMNRASDEPSLRGSHEHLHSVLFAHAQRPLAASIINGWRFRLPLERQQDFIQKSRAVHERLVTAFEMKNIDAVRKCVRDEYTLIATALELGETNER
jgi:DNA-binding GntR family transcriptional regulator